MEKTKRLIVSGREIEIKVSESPVFKRNYNITVTGNDYYQCYSSFEDDLEADLIHIEELTEKALAILNKPSIDLVLEKLGYV